MGRITALIIALLMILTLSSCAGDDDGTDYTSTAQNESPSSQMSTTFTNNAASQTTADTSGFTDKTGSSSLNPTTDVSSENKTTSTDTTTNYNDKTTSSGTTQSTTSASIGSVLTYNDFPCVPDFGKMLNINYMDRNENTFIYSVSDVYRADPEGESSSEYEALLKKLGYKAVGYVVISSIKYYGFESAEYNTTVLFASSVENGIIIISILKTK